MPTRSKADHLKLVPIAEHVPAYYSGYAEAGPYKGLKIVKTVKRYNVSTYVLTRKTKRGYGTKLVKGAYKWHPTGYWSWSGPECRRAVGMFTWSGVKRRCECCGKLEHE